MVLRIRTGLVLSMLLAAGGCMSSGPQTGGYIPPLQPAPTGQVQMSQLPPPPAPPPPPMPQSAGLPPADAALGGAVADVGGAAKPTETASAGPVTRESLVGAWKVSSGGGNCQIFMALTKWTGGYRAASRGCPGQVADVSAWDVSGSQVVLKDSSGSSVASLSSSGGNRYDGRTSGGQSISLYR